MIFCWYICHIQRGHRAGHTTDARCRRLELLGTCQIDEDNLHEQSPVECVGFGEAISNVTLELKP